MLKNQKKKRKEYGKHKTMEKRKCDHIECKEEGLYKAPKDRTLKDYYYFCLKHVKEYNKKWNYYKDASAEEVEKDIRGQYGWERPTWKFGVKKKIFNDPFGFSEEIGLRAKKKNASKFTKEQQEALDFFKIVPPFSKTELSKKYRALAKTYHPDINKRDDTMFKKTVEFYQILKKMLGD